MKQAKNWNGNLLCSIDIETTGLDPKNDDLLEVAIIPLGPDLRPHKEVIPFELVIAPKDPDKFKRNQILLPGMPLSEVLLHGVEYWNAGDLIQMWFDRLNLPEKKRIIPLGHNYANFDQVFLKEWLCPQTYDYLFDYHVRDTLSMGLYLNDVADWLGQEVPFPKVSLKYMCSCLKIPNDRPHRALSDALATSQLYREMVTRVGPNLVAMSKALLLPFDASENDSVARTDLVDAPPPQHT